MDRKAILYIDAKLEQRKKDVIDLLSDGGARDLVHYKELCGFIRGLQAAQTELGDLVRRMKEFEDD
jgi:hypothetical protein